MENAHEENMLLASAAIIGVMFLATHANAQGVPQSVEITKVDVQKVAAGYGGRHGGGGYDGGYYVAPPVIYSGDYAPGYAYEPDYYPPPVVYGPGIGINVGLLGIRIR